MVEKWFGENWLDYAKGIDSAKLVDFEKSLLRFLPKEEWKNTHFIDIGCGSGAFSLSAFALGAEKVTSIDIDEKSIEATTFMKNSFGKKYEKNWEIANASILDNSIVNSLENKGDIVYAWGSLHHTGNMEKAIGNASRIARKNGFFILAIYNHAKSSENWLKIKKCFSSLPKPMKTVVELGYAFFVSLCYMISRRTLNLKKERGMDVFHDAIDWMRGYPYEFASSNDIIKSVEARGFRLEKMITKLEPENGKNANLLETLRAKNIGCNEFLFKKIN